MTPTWIEPSRTVTEISACVPAEVRVADAVRSATVAAESRHAIDLLLRDVVRAETEADEARAELAHMKLVALWTGVAAVAGLVLGVGLAVAR